MRVRGAASQVGWLDWNLILDTSGGPNHLKNLCDANIIADPLRTQGKGTLIQQAPVASTRAVGRAGLSACVLL